MIFLADMVAALVAFGGRAYSEPERAGRVPGETGWA